MSEKEKLAQKDYKAGMKYKDIAEKYKVSLDTVKSWKRRFSWSREKPAHKNCTQKKCAEKLFEAADENAELTEKQKLFCVFYAEKFNATQAYLKAYGGKKNVAGVSAHELLKKSKIQAEIQRLKNEMRKHYNFGFEDYVRELLKIVGGDIGDYVKFGRRDEEIVINKKGDTVTKKVNFVDLAESDAVDTSVISEIKQIKGDISIKLADKSFAVKELARIFGFGAEVNDSELPTVFVENLRKDTDEK